MTDVPSLSLLRPAKTEKLSLKSYFISAVSVSTSASALGIGLGDKVGLAAPLIWMAPERYVVSPTSTGPTLDLTAKLVKFWSFKIYAPFASVRLEFSGAVEAVKTAPSSYMKPVSRI